MNECEMIHQMMTFIAAWDLGGKSALSTFFGITSNEELALR